jgi:hypothetical protein
MECPDITTLEQAEATLPSSVLPISGLRRNEDGLLTEDARNTIMDGLKSRGVNFTNAEEIKRIINELFTVLCSTRKQYEFLLREYMVNGMPTDEQVKILIQKNFMVTDIITISRHITKTMEDNIRNPTMIEGWQDMKNAKPAADSNDALMKKLARDRALLEGFTSTDLGRQQVDITKEKNKIASNYLGMYGFLNLFAVGLILYLAASK